MNRFITVILILIVFNSNIFANIIDDGVSLWRYGNTDEASKIFIKACNEGMYKGCVNYAELTAGKARMMLKEDRSASNSTIIEYYAKASLLGYNDGVQVLARKFSHGEGTFQDYQNIIDIFQSLCEKGNNEGCNSLAKVYNYGILVPIDKKKSMQLFLKSCKSGNSDSCLQASQLLYQGGYGNPKTFKKALQLAEKAQALDTTPTDTYKYLISNIKSSIKHPPRYSNNIKSKPIKITDYHKSAISSIKKHNYPQAFKYFRKSCDDGKGVSCTVLGTLYSQKEYGKFNMIYSAYFNSKACNLDDYEGCNNLAVNYYNGEGVHKNLKKSIDLFKKACNNGYKESCKNYEILRQENKKN